MSLSSTSAAPAIFKVAKSHPDDWSSNPLQVKSCFTVSFSSTTPAAGHFQTEAYGLGWSFASTCESVRFERVEKVQKKRGHKGLKLTSSKRQCKVSLSMHPGAVRNILSGRLHVKASVSEDMVERAFQLPIELSELPIGNITRGDLDLHESYSFDVTVTLDVSTDSTPNLITPHPVVELEIRDIVTASLDGEFPIDIKFMLFTRHSANGRACAPRAVFVTSRMLKGQGAFIDRYSPEPEDTPVVCFADSSLPNLKQTASPQETSGDCMGYWNPNRPARLGSVKSIKDVAYPTFKSLIAWIYTGKIVFKPLKSVGPVPRDPNACSPKSMYRLATRAGLDELKKLAFDNLCSQLTEENVVQELFSTFSRDNSEVLEMELTVLLKYFSTTRVHAEWENMIDVAKGYRNCGPAHRVGSGSGSGGVLPAPGLHEERPGPQP
ncbi:hypothetical protein EDD18DRAFT_1158632 [Armillaria luteobubalina]|uniref:BTB domain-containing protein n=1 Tax=Armillaria luteobubalina TaxID=153913 RepID=A0AA39QAB5_9AGAR|nr:hypothetical protein EDD18DRAFT_1158632 [Armillaria luteobubalina]